MKLLSFPFLDALSSCLSSHSDSSASLSVHLHTYSLKPDRAFRELESRLNATLDAEDSARRARSSSIASILEAGAGPSASPPAPDDAPEFAPAAPAARAVPRKTLVSLIATLNECFADYDFGCVARRVTPRCTATTHRPHANGRPAGSPARATSSRAATCSAASLTS